MATHGSKSGHFSYFFLLGEPTSGSTTSGKVIDCIRKGYSWTIVHRCQKDFGIKDDALAQIIGVSGRTLTRTKKAGAVLDPIASDRFYRAVKVFRLAMKVFENRESAVRWLQREQPGLGGKIPMTLLDTEPGTHAVETLLGQLEYGVLP